MAIDKIKRKKIEKLVLDVVRALDTGNMPNYTRYEDMFKIMDDNQFEAWAKTMGHDPDDTIQMYQLPFEEMSMNQIKDAAKILDIPLEEYIWYYHTNPDGIRTRVRVPVGYVHVKRMQQLLSKKNKYGIDSSETDFKTGQVKNDSKVGMLTPEESFSLITIGADKALEEFLGFRADNQFKKQQSYREINRDGYTLLADKEHDVSQNTTLNTMNTYFLASGIRSDLVTRALKTPYTVKVETDSRG